MNILIIDDDRQVRLSVAAVLGGAGHKTFVAADGEEGFSHIRRTLFDIAIVDMMMPNKDGIETIKEMRKLHPGIKIIAISGGGTILMNDYLPFAKELGAAKTLEKPFDAETLLGAVDALSAP